MLLYLMVVIQGKKAKCFKIQENSFLASKKSSCSVASPQQNKLLSTGRTAKMKQVPLCREDLIQCQHPQKSLSCCWSFCTRAHGFKKTNQQTKTTPKHKTTTNKQHTHKKEIAPDPQQHQVAWGQPYRDSRVHDGSCPLKQHCGGACL